MCCQATITNTRAKTPNRKEDNHVACDFAEACKKRLQSVLHPVKRLCTDREKRVERWVMKYSASLSVISNINTNMQTVLISYKNVVYATVKVKDGVFDLCRKHSSVVCSYTVIFMM